MQVSEKELNYIKILNDNENKWIATSQGRDTLFFSDKSLTKLVKKLKEAHIEDYVLTKVKPANVAYIS